MYNRALIVVAFAALVKCHDIATGPNTGKKIFDETKRASPAIWRQDDNITVSANDDEVISRVTVTDLRPEKDGDVKIVDGGEGHKNVTLELKSPTVLRGYEFRIEVYAVPEIKSGNDQDSSTITSSMNDGLSMGRTTSPSKGNVPAIVSKDENKRPARTLMTEDKESGASLNIPISLSESTTEPDNKESIDCTTEVPKNNDDMNEENIKRAKDDAENHEIVDFVIEDMNDQSEKAALTSDSLKKENTPMEVARSNGSTNENDGIPRDATNTDKIETTTQSDDITSTTSNDNEDDSGKIDLDFSEVPSIISKMEPSKELPSTNDRQDSRSEVPVIKHLGNQRNFM